MLRHYWGNERSSPSLLDLSTNICYDKFLTINETFDISKYPTEYTNYTHLSAFHNVPIDNIAVGLGLGELIPRIFNCLRDKSVTFTLPNWQLLEIICKTNNIQYHVENYHNFNQLDITRLFDRKTDMLYITNPNGVNGSVIDKETILELSNVYEIVIVDEAYMDFSNQSVINSNRDNIIVCKSFSKTIASPGLRFGYCIAGKHLIEQIQDNRPGYVMINYDIGNLLTKISDHIYRMLETRKYIDTNYNTIVSHGNFVLFNEKPKLNCITKEIHNGIHRMSLTDLTTFKNLCKD